MRVLVVAASLLLTAPLSAAFADAAGEYTFTVSMDGATIGEHRFAFAQDGDRMEIEEETDIKVRVALIPVFRFQHERREVWQNGRALSITGKTNNNGRKLDIKVTPDDDGYVRTINGHAEKFDKSTAILAWWRKDILEHDRFFSVMEDKTVRISFEYVGKESISLAGQEIEVDHYRTRGDERRDFWLDAAGHVAKVKFRRRGSEIQYLRNEATYRR